MTTPTDKIEDKDMSEWHVFDAATMPLGRLATQAAHLLMGKHRTDFAKNIVAPVYVVVTNSDQVQLTGNKMEQKMYHEYSGYSGGLRSRTAKDQISRDSRKVIEFAVSGMLPKNNSRAECMRHLKVYTGAQHPHVAQVAKS